MTNKEVRATLKKLQDGDAVVVTWCDAYSTDEWKSWDEMQLTVDKTMAVQTLGFVCAVGGENLRLASSFGEDNGCAFAYMTVPKRWVKSIRKVKAK